MYDALKNKMKEHRYSALKLAKATDIKPSTLAARLSGTGEFQFTEAYKIAKILGIKPAECNDYFSKN